MKYEIVDTYTDGGDYVVDFEVNGKILTFVWDGYNLLEDLLKDMTEEEVLKSFGDE